MPRARTQPAPSTPSVPAGYDGPRACGPFELAGVLDLANLVLRTLNTPAEASPRHPTVGGDYPHIYNAANLDNIRVVARNGRVVSSVAIFPMKVRTPRGVISVGGINAFVTHPDHRRQGLGEAVLRDAHARMRANGHHIGWLSTRIHDYYRKFGWESAGRQRSFVFDRGNIDRLPASRDLTVDEEWRADVAQLNALHDGEPLVVPRGVDRFTLLAQRKFARLFVARRAGAVVAYAGTSGTAVREFGGPADDVAALVRAVFTRLDDPTVHTSERPPGQRATIEMTVIAPPTGTGLPGLLERLGIPHHNDYGGMLLALDAPGLFEALRIRTVALRRRGDGWRLTHGAHTLDVSARGLVKLLFGPERTPGFAPNVFPVPFYLWPADRV